jgi:GNAT superfamily N-acetyltransferase
VTVAFTFGGHRAVAAQSDDALRVQRFFEENPEYSLLCDGRRPTPTEGADFIADAPPAEFPCRAQYNLLLEDDAGEITGVMAVASDLFAPGVWHLGLMIVATRLHGRGVGGAAYRAYEAWARAHGARWLRLGVVEHNAPARAFWQRQGYVEIRRREGVAMGALSNTVLVMWKSAGASLQDYLVHVPRDAAPG